MDEQACSRLAASSDLVVWRVRRAKGWWARGTKRVLLPRRVVQSFQPQSTPFSSLAAPPTLICFVSLILRLRVCARGLLLHVHLSRRVVQTASGTASAPWPVVELPSPKKSSSTCHRGTSYSPVGVVARNVIQ